MNDNFLDKIKRMFEFKKHLFVIFSMLITVFIIFVNIPLTIGGQIIDSLVSNLPIVGNALSAFDVISLVVIDSSKISVFNYIAKALPHIFSIFITVYVFTKTNSFNRFIDGEDFLEEKENYKIFDCSNSLLYVCNDYQSYFLKKSFDYFK